MLGLMLDPPPVLTLAGTGVGFLAVGGLAVFFAQRRRGSVELPDEEAGPVRGWDLQSDRTP